MENTENQKIETTDGQTIKKNSFPKRGRRFFRTLIWLIVILIVIALIGVFSYFSPFKSGFGERRAWQAVFLVTGQTYFGRITKETKELIVLKEVYYLKEVPTAEGKENASRLTVAKLDDELHGPENQMRINKSFILFVENLKPSSEIVKIIESFKK